MKIRFLLIGLVLILFSSSEGVGQARKCGKIDKGVNYKVLFRDTSDAPAEIFMEIYLEVFGSSDDPASEEIAGRVLRLRHNFCPFL